VGGWSQVIAGFAPKIVDECRAGILVGSRLPISDKPEAALAVQQWAASEKGVELWIVDDLCGLAEQQPIFAGIVVHQAFGLDGDHRIGLTPAELASKTADALKRMAPLRSALGALLKPHGAEPGPLGASFVWSGPLCGGFLVKGVFREEYRDEDLWYESEAPIRIFPSSRGARQDEAPGGVLGIDLYHTTYDSSGEPPLLTPDLLASGDERLKHAGLLADARIFVLPHYD
jgi:hypothetical protein